MVECKFWGAVCTVGMVWCVFKIRREDEEGKDSLCDKENEMGPGDEGLGLTRLT